MMLSNNNLQGAVPASFCNLTSMDHVQLSHNPLLTCYPQCIFDAPAGPLSKLVTKNKDLDAGIKPCAAGKAFPGAVIPSSLPSFSPSSARALATVVPTIVPTKAVKIDPLGKQPTFMGFDHFMTDILIEDTQSRALCKVRGGLAGQGVFDWTCDFAVGLPTATSKPVCKWNLIECDPNGMVTSINMYGQKLTGSLSSYIGLLTDLITLVFNKNTLTGTVPSEVGQLVQLTLLGISYNAFKGIFFV